MYPEDLSLKRKIGDIDTIREKEDREPILLVRCKSKAAPLFITFSCDFGLQAFINAVLPQL